MGQTPSNLLHRLMIIVPMILLFGFLIFLKDKLTGAAILIGGALALIYGIILYYKIKKDSVSENKISARMKKTSSYFLIIGGILLIIIGLILFIIEKNISKDVIYNVGLGLIFLILGIYQLKNKQAQETKWKDIPLGFKILIVYFSISVLSNLINLPKSVNQPNMILGIFVNPPFSAFLSLVYLIFLLILVLSILSKTGWKLVSGIALFNFLNISFMVFRIMLMPSNELSARFDLPVDSLNALGSNIILIVFIPLIIIALAIFLYINKNKEYFSNDK